VVIIVVPQPLLDLTSRVVIEGHFMISCYDDLQREGRGKNGRNGGGWSVMHHYYHHYYNY